jgi:sugar lactone lactonase YvrE
MYSLSALFWRLACRRGAACHFQRLFFTLASTGTLLLCGALSAHAQTPIDFAPATTPQPVGQATSAQSVMVMDTLSGSESVSTVEVLTRGISGLDFANAGGGTCSGANLLQNQTCTVNVTFTPAAPGLRKGAVVLLDSSNNVIGTTYIYGYGQGPLGVFTPGTISTAAGSGVYTVYNNNQTSIDGDLDQPSAIALDGAGNLYIADSLHNVIREVTPSNGSYANGIMTTIAGTSSPGYTGDGGPAIDATLDGPRGLAIDGAGNLYIADTNNNVIREINAVTHVITTIAGTGAAGPGGNGPALSATLRAPEGVAVDASGNVYVADTGNQLVRKISGGQITTIAGDGYVDANGNGRFAGDGGPATSASLNKPLAVALDSSGNIYIADSQNNRVREVFTSGAQVGDITTFAGSSSVGFGGDGGPATSAALYTPSGLAFDAAGNLYISDTQNERIRKVYAAGPQAGDINTIAGNGALDYTGDGGAATSAAIYDPLGLAIDGQGNLFIAAALNQRVREIYATPVELLVSSQFPVRISQASAVLDQNLEDDGNSPLSITSITPDSNASYSAADTTCSTSSPVSVDTTCTIGAQFAPTGSTLGVETGHITIADNASNTPQIIDITGTAESINAVTITILGKPNPAVYQQNIVFSINVASAPSTGTPSGTVTIASDGTQIGTATLDANGNATFSTNSLPIGTHTITVTYPGDSVHEKGTQTYTQVVLPPTQIQLTSSTPGNTAVYGTNITFTATFTGESGGPIPTGSVTFTANNQTYVAPISPSGVATVSINNLPVGTDAVTASYAGDTNNPPSNASLNEVITAIQTTLQLMASNTAPTYGSDVIFTATITPTPTGTGSESVAFYDSASCTGALLGTGTVGSGQAAITTNQLPAGTDTICAKYSGDSIDAAATATVTVTVAKLQPSMALTASPASPSLAGTPLTFTATLTGSSTPPSGQVTFTANGNAFGSAVTLVHGVATLSGVSLPPGAYTVAASYAGDSNNLSATASIPYSSTQAQTAVAITPNPAAGIAGIPDSLTARVTVTSSVGITGSGGIPTGTVQFYSNGTALGAPQTLVNGVASFATPAFDPGTYAITAAYSGDKNNAGSNSASDPLTVVQAKTSVALTSSSPNNTSVATEPVTFTATVKNQDGGPVPSGNVIFSDGGTALATVALNGSGVAIFTTSNLTVGTHSIVAAYASSTDDAGSQSNTVAQVVQPIPTSVTLGTSLSTATTAQQVILVASVTGNPAQPVPSGTVQYFSGATNLGYGTVNASGVATFSPVLNPGTYTITAQYQPNDNIHAPSTSQQITLTITPGNGFIFLPDSSTFTLTSGQNKTLSFTLQSNDNFTDTIDFGCAALPPGVTCQFSQPNVALAANGTATETVTIDTASPLSSGTQASLHPGNRSGTVLAGVFLPLGLIFGLIFLRGRRRNAALFTVMLLLMLAGTTFIVTGCGGVNFTGASPGTYTFQIVGTGENTHVTRSINVSMTVTK